MSAPRTALAEPEARLPSTSGYTPPRTSDYTPVLPAPASDDARLRDAHVDRVLLMPTAETQPAGSTVLSSYEIVVVQVTHAFSNDTQLTLTATPPIEGIVPFDFSLKSVLSRGDGYRLAAFGAVSGASGLDNGPAWVGRVGLLGQACFDRACRSSANLGATALLLGPASFVATGVGVIWRVSELFALLGELDTLVPAGRSVAEWHGIAGGLGCRWSGRRWAVDLAAYSAFETRTVVPFLAVSYRFLP
ncbi:MAG: hypothetical protein QM756_26655 [Polyangiaceae bacterium]